MRKLLLLILFLLFIPASGHAWSVIMIAGSSPSGLQCGGLSDCSAEKLFDWDCSVEAMDSNVCSAGDNTGVATGEISVAGGLVVLADGSNDGGDYYTFDVSGHDIYPAGDFTITFTMDFDVIEDTGFLWRAISVGGDELMTILINNNAGNDIQIIRKVNNIVTINETFDVNFALSTSLDVVVKGRTVGSPGMSVKIGGTTATSATVITSHLAGDPIVFLHVGNESNDNMEGTIDDVRIYSGWCNDL